MAETPTHAGPSFLGQLLARAQPTRVDASVAPGAAGASRTMALPALERRRPSLFEPRAGTPTTRPDIDLADEAIDALPSRPMSSVHERPPTFAPIHDSAPPSSPQPSMPGTLVAPPSASLSSGATPHASPSVERDVAPSRSVTTRHADDDTPTRPARLRADAASEQRPTRAEPRTSASPRDPHHATTPRSRDVQREAAAPVAPARVVVERTRIETQTRVHERTSPAAAPASRTQAREGAPASAPLRAPPRVVLAQAPTRAVAHPSRSALHAPAPHAPGPAPVQVSIGRIEIRAATGAGTPAAGTRRQTNAPRLGLDDYLRQRHGSGR